MENHSLHLIKKNHSSRQKIKTKKETNGKS